MSSSVAPDVALSIGHVVDAKHAGARASSPAACVAEACARTSAYLSTPSARDTDALVSGSSAWRARDSGPELANWGARRGDKEELENVLAIVFWNCLCWPLYFCVHMSQAILYRASPGDDVRDCPALHDAALTHVALWPVNLFVHVGSWVLWSVFVESARFRALCCWCATCGYAHVLVCAPMLVTCAGTLAWEIWAIRAYATSADAAHCADSGLAMVTRAAMASGIWLALIGVRTVAIYTHYPGHLYAGYYRLSEATRRARLDAATALAEQCVTDQSAAGAAYTITFSGRPGFGQHAALLNVVRLCAAKQVGNNALLLAEHPDGHADPAFRALQGRRTGTTKDHVRLQHAAQRTRTHVLSAADFAGASSAATALNAAPASASPSGAGTSSASTATGGSGVELAPSHIRVDVAPASNLPAASDLRVRAWPLSADLMALLFRFTGPASLVTLQRVSVAWRHTSHWTRLLPLWWADATAGDRLASSALPLEPARLMRYLLQLGGGGGRGGAAARDVYCMAHAGYLVRFVAVDLSPHRRLNSFLVLCDASSCSTTPAASILRSEAGFAHFCSLIPRSHALLFWCGAQKPFGQLHVHVFPLPQLVLAPRASLMVAGTDDDTLDDALLFGPQQSRRGGGAGEGTPYICWWTHVRAFRELVDGASETAAANRARVRALLPSLDTDVATLRQALAFKEKLPAAGAAGAGAGGAAHATQLRLYQRVGDLMDLTPDALTADMAFSERVLLMLRVSVLTRYRTARDPPATRVWLSDGALHTGGTGSGVNGSDGTGVDAPNAVRYDSDDGSGFEWLTTAMDGDDDANGGANGADDDPTAFGAPLRDHQRSSKNPAYSAFVHTLGSRRASGTQRGFEEPTPLRAERKTVFGSGAGAGGGAASGDAAAAPSRSLCHANTSFARRLHAMADYAARLSRTMTPNGVEHYANAEQRRRHDRSAYWNRVHTLDAYLP